MDFKKYKIDKNQELRVVKNNVYLGEFGTDDPQSRILVARIMKTKDGQYYFASMEKGDNIITSRRNPKPTFDDAVQHYIDWNYHGAKLK